MKNTLLITLVLLVSLNCQSEAVKKKKQKNQKELKVMKIENIENISNATYNLIVDGGDMPSETRKEKISINLQTKDFQTDIESNEEKVETNKNTKGQLKSEQITELINALKSIKLAEDDKEVLIEGGRTDVYVDLKYKDGETFRLYLNGYTYRESKQTVTPESAKKIHTFFNSLTSSK